MPRIRHTLILLVAIAAVLVPAQAAMASPQQVIRDCAQDGKLDHHYSLSDLKKAEKKLPTDVDEYTNCRDVINQAEEQGSGGHSHGSSNGPLGGTGGPGSGGGGGGNSTVSPSDVNALNHAKNSGNAPSLSLHGEKVVPGTGGVFKTAGAANSVPMPVLLALIAVGLLTATGGVVALRRRFPEVFGAALRILRR
ncbi:MAG TPA: hypothetical protein VJU60_03600 [Thermoleophilaceae bacterium]|nr:hypothetical protein [Thermoleophilaceae bacterium]